MKFSRKALVEEVSELTTLLRTDRLWESLRAALRSKGIVIETSFLGGFLEDEEHGQYGVVVTDAGKVIEFVRNTREGNRFRKWKATSRIKEVAEKKFPAVLVAVELAAESLPKKATPKKRR